MALMTNNEAQKAGMAPPVPDWYPLVQCAKWLGVAPWELARQPAAWLDMVMIAAEAEAKAREYFERQRQH